jgi:alpha-L-fucosidase
MIRNSIVFLFVFLVSVRSVSGQQMNSVVIDPADSEQEIIRKAANIVPTPRQLRWQQLELTGFFHFGINTFTGKEWGTGKEEPKLFNPTQLDADQWVRTAKEAGIRQIILTAKHHDGFCLWPTKTTEHSVKSSPWKGGKGDVVKEVAEACKKYKTGFGIYLSPWDMNSPLYGTEAYNDFFVLQLTELLTNYGRIDEVWFDGANGEGPNGKKQVYDFERWYKLIRKLQPDAVIAIMGPDVRWVGTETGHGRETEWSVVPVDNLDQSSVAADSQQDIAFKPQGDMMGSDLGSRDKIKTAKGLVWYPAETDVSIRPGWFYHEGQNDKVKTPQQLLDIYFHSVGRNGVLLLNIPPDKRGLVHENDVQALREWKKKRDAIFQTNLAKSANVSFKGKKVRVLVDGSDATHLTVKELDAPVVIELWFKKPQTFNVLSLQENIRLGQRIEKFVLEYWKNNEWKIATQGTTVGYKRLLRFDAATAAKVRLRILSSRLDPALAELGLYFESQRSKSGGKEE